MKMPFFTQATKLLVNRAGRWAPFRKGLHVSSVGYQQTERQCTEVQIPVPWGHIAGKWWGPRDKRPVLCLHGYLESCGSFDPLLQLLAPDTGFLAVDWPGQGHSSCLPPGMYYHGIDAPILIRRIQKHFAWPAVSLLSHSMAGGFALLFTCLYPDDVDLLMQIDGLKPFSDGPGSGLDALAANIDQFLRYDAIRTSGSAAPTYTYDEAVHTLLEGIVFQDSVTPHSARHVLDRTIGPAPHDPARYVFLRDIRTKVDISMRMQHADICESVKRITCPMLTIKCLRSSYYEQRRYVEDVAAVLQQHNARVELVFVEGTHHVHVNTPEVIAPIVNGFLAKYGQRERNAPM